MVAIHFPQDPASSGKDIAFFFKQEYEPQGYTVVVEPVTGKKTARADEFSSVVNLAKFFVVSDDGSGRYLTPEEMIRNSHESSVNSGTLRWLDRRVIPEARPANRQRTRKVPAEIHKPTLSNQRRLYVMLADWSIKVSI